MKQKREAAAATGKPAQQLSEAEAAEALEKRRILGPPEIRLVGWHGRAFVERGLTCVSQRVGWPRGR